MYNLIGEISDSSGEDDSKLEDYLTSAIPVVSKELPIEISPTHGEKMKVVTKRNIKRVSQLGKHWNKMARFGALNETVRGWLKKSTKRRDAQRRILYKKRPGTTALREIKFYQKCRVLLIPQKSFG